MRCKNTPVRGVWGGGGSDIATVSSARYTCIISTAAAVRLYNTCRPGLAAWVSVVVVVVVMPRFVHLSYYYYYNIYPPVYARVTIRIQYCDTTHDAMQSR